MSEVRLLSSRFGRAALSSVSLLLSACTDSGGDEEIASAPEGLRRAIAAMGGWATMREARNETIEATGQRFHSPSGVRPGTAVLVSEYAVTQTTEVRDRRLRRDIEHTTRYLPLPAPLEYREVIDGRSGYVAGADSLGGPQPVDPAPMLSSRLTASLKHADLASPLRLISRALDESAAVTEAPDAAFADGHQDVLDIRFTGEAPIRLFLDSTTHLPAKVEAIEDHPPVGDSVVEMTYADYRDVAVPHHGDVLLPFHVALAVDGVACLTEERSAVAVNAPDAIDYTVAPDVTAPFDEALGGFGRRSAQWLIGYQHIGFPFFFNEQSAAPVTLVELAPGVYHVTGPSHHQLVVEMNDHVIVVDAPLYESRSAAVLAEIERAIPDKPIRHIVATHFHYDHSGGFRHYAAEGGVTVWSAAQSTRFFRRALDNLHTVVPDRLQQNPTAVDVRPIDVLQTFTDEGRKVEVHKVASSHSEDMLVVYLPNERILFNTDLFSPGDVPPLPPPSSTWARDLYDEVTRLGLDVAQIAGGHGEGTATMAELRAAAGL